MNNIRKILSEYEGEFNPEGWAQLEKRLPKQTFMQKFGKIIIAGASVIIASAGIFALTFFNNEIQTNENIAKTEIAGNETNTNSNTPQTEVISEIENEKIVATEIPEQTTNLPLQENQEPEISHSEIEISPNETSEHQPTEETSQQTTIHENKKSEPITEPLFSYNCDLHCAPANVKFTATNVDADCEVIWDFGNGKQAKGTNVSYEYTKKGNFNPSVSVYKNGKLETAKTLNTIEINSAPEIDFSWRNNEALYTFSTDRNLNIDCKWYIEDKIYTSQKAEYEFVRNGDYAVKLVVTDKNGCSSEVNKTVKVVIAHVFYVPTAFTPDETGVNSTFGPIGEDMNFKNFSFSIASSKGEVVFVTTDVNEQWNGKINNVGSDVATGVYYWTIKTVDEFGNSQTKKGTVTVIR